MKLDILCKNVWTIPMKAHGRMVLLLKPHYPGIRLSVL